MPQPTLEQLAAERYVSLVTFRRNGNGVATPIWIAPHGGRLYAFTDGTSAKMKRLKNNDRIRVAACDARGNVRGPYVDGRARRVDEPALADAAMAALTRKYGWQLTAISFVSRLFGRIDRRAIIEFTV